MVQCLGKMRLRALRNLMVNEEVEFELGVKILRTEEGYLVIVNLPLFGKPNWEEEALEGKEVEDLPKRIEKLGQQLHLRLRIVAEKIRAIRELGFRKSEVQSAIYSLEYFKEASQPEEAIGIAEQTLNRLRAVEKKPMGSKPAAIWWHAGT